MLVRINENSFQEIIEIKKTDFEGNEYTIQEAGKVWTEESIQNEINSIDMRVGKYQVEKQKLLDFQTQMQTLLTN